MEHCVSESSYNVLFICAVVIAVFLLILSAYAWDKFNKASEKRLPTKSAQDGKTISLISLIISIIAIGLLIVLFFVYQKKLVTYMQKINQASSVMSSQGTPLGSPPSYYGRSRRSY